MREVWAATCGLHGPCMGTYDLRSLDRIGGRQKEVITHKGVIAHRERINEQPLTITGLVRGGALDQAAAPLCSRRLPPLCSLIMGERSLRPWFKAT